MPSPRASRPQTTLERLLFGRYVYLLCAVLMLVAAVLYAIDGS